jgi:hypothetical protein
MTLIVEDGTGKSDSESYISVADADAYMQTRGFSIWVNLSELEKEQALRRATDYMQQVYRLRWKGDRVSSTQALDWPRNFVQYADYAFITRNGAQQIGGYFYYPADEVPEEVARACAQLALLAAAGDLYPEQGQAVKREEIGPIKVEYQDYTSAGRKFPAVDGIIAPFLKPRNMTAVRA